MCDAQLSSMFDLSGLTDIRVSVEEKSIFIEGSLPGLPSCPSCNGKHLHRQTKRHRFLRLPPVGSKHAKVQVNCQKQYCVSCKATWWPKVPFANGIERMTHSFTSHVLDLLRFGTIKDVSKHLDMSWDVVKSIHKKTLQERYQEIDVSAVEYVSIDEFSIAKGHKYMTTIMDIKTGRILQAIEGRKKTDIAPYLQELKKKLPILKLLPWI